MFRRRSFANDRLWHEWKVRDLAFRAWAISENARPHNRQRGFIINPYVFGGTPQDPYFANVVSLLHFNDGNGSTAFTDQTGKTWTVSTSGTAIEQTGTFKYGIGALETDTTKRGIKTANHADWDFGSGAFCTECWFFVAAFPASFAALYCKSASPAFGPFFVYVSAGSQLGALASFNGSSFAVSLLDAGTHSISTWYHAAFFRSSNDWYLTLNGVQVGTTNQSGTLVSDSGEVFIGTNDTSANSFAGYTDDFRATKGVARYNGAGFTPPASQHPDS